MNREAKHVADELKAALVEAYPIHVAARVRVLDVHIDLSGSVSEGRAWLKSSLDELLALPFEEQTRGPLEVFQEAMKFPTRALHETGLAPVDRDEAAERNLPGDLYDLAPASSSVLGEHVWSAHLAWGAAKAHAMTGGGR